MPDSEWGKLLLKFLPSGVLLSCLLLLSVGRFAPSAGARAAQAEPPALSVEAQPDSPLRLSFQRYELTRPDEPEVVIDVVNVGSKAVRAYTISETTAAGDDTSRSAAMNDYYLSASMLRPGQLTTESLGFSARPDKQTRITVSVDYVEFADGTTWGADLYKAHDRLGGRRAGTRKAVEHLIKILEAGGPQAVMDAIAGGAPDFAPPLGHPSGWEEGFREGLTATASQLRHVTKDGGLPQVGPELRRLREKTGRSNLGSNQEVSDAFKVND